MITGIYVARRRRPARLFLFGALVPALVLAWGCSPPPARTPEAPKVNVAHPEARELAEYEEFNGRLEPDHTVEVRSRVRGHIVEVRFRDGDYVNKGDVIFVLDPRDFDAAVGRAEDRMRVAEAQFRAAEAEARRERILAAGSAASQATLEKAIADAASLAAQVSAAGNEVTRANLDKEYSQIKAEIAGRIGAANLSEGNLVNAGGGDPLLATVVAIDSMRVVFNVDDARCTASLRAAGWRARGWTTFSPNSRTPRPPLCSA